MYNTWNNSKKVVYRDVQHAVKLSLYTQNHLRWWHVNKRLDFIIVAVIFILKIQTMLLGFPLIPLTTFRGICTPLSTLRCPEVHIRVIYLNVNAWFVWNIWRLMICMSCMWYYKWCMSMYECNFYYDLAIVFKYYWRVELHNDTKNKAIGTKIANTEIIHISAVYGWCHLWIGGKSVTPRTALWHSVNQ